MGPSGYKWLYEELMTHNKTPLAMDDEGFLSWQIQHMAALEAKKLDLLAKMQARGLKHPLAEAGEAAGAGDGAKLDS